jgi:hypothetical protein
MKSAALLALVAAYIAAGQTIGPQSRNFEVDFNGGSGSFKLYLNSNGSNTFYNFAFRQLVEVDSSGTPISSSGSVRKMDLGSGVTWTPYTGTQLVGVRGTAASDVPMSSGGGSPTFPVAVTINCALSYVDTTATVSNVTIPVIANTLKIAMNTTGWQMSSSSNKVRLWIKMSSNAKGGGPDNNFAPPTSDTNKGKVYKLPATGTYSAQIELEDYAYIDNGSGGLVKMPATVDTSSSQNQQYIDLPATTDGRTVFWDPVIAAVGNSALTAALSVGALVLALLAGTVTLF